MSALELGSAIRRGEAGAAEAVAACIDAAERDNPRYGAFLCLLRERALARAKAVQARIDSGEALSALAGVPVAVKDNISTQGVATTCASAMLERYVPVYDATVITKLEAAGMIVIGKCNMDEFAMGGSSETGAFGPVCNPRRVTHVAGGSSGGSAAAVAARLAPLALGSDTGGSIRQPCAFCGVTGIKPTYGSVSRHGLIAYASSLDQIGPLARDIDDCAALLSVISGPCALDSTCVIDAPFDFSRQRPENLRGTRIGLPRNYLARGIDEDVRAAVAGAAREFEAAGAAVDEFDMPLMDYMVPAYYIIACAEASSNLSRYDGLKYGYKSPAAKTLSDVYRLSRSEGFGLEVKRRIMLGSFVLSSGYYDAYYNKALQIRALIKDAYNKLFERYDMLLSPVAPTAAYALGENIGDPMKMYMGDIYTVSVNLAGLPAAALPCGLSREGLPIGFQLVGDSFSEGKLIAAGRVYQSRTAHHTAACGGDAL
ncbi:MAG: Asp-tRNA(Asn)/Glu-tRNA(Gln) amidotransferase subunit GatA [Oscillospiraceae bacterium]|jgi:aspartyl-tRNA(Asn)/glutamyl-tRNA(Gln) amidotransferase subunit A|nr:Asp-tRNA(Asn)/Glu-tRNA(Gln) amidotransferase subunit GatA [Oscillospiraceae bacterium]